MPFSYSVSWQSRLVYRRYSCECRGQPEMGRTGKTGSTAQVQVKEGFTLVQSSCKKETCEQLHEKGTLRRSRTVGAGPCLTDARLALSKSARNVYLPTVHLYSSNSACANGRGRATCHLRSQCQLGRSLVCQCTECCSVVSPRQLEWSVGTTPTHLGCSCLLNAWACRLMDEAVSFTMSTQL